MKQLFTVKEFALAVGVHKNTIYNQVWSNRIKASRVGRQIRIPIAELERYTHPTEAFHKQEKTSALS